eukprot:CAMPEP_0173409878 /NCGR_PEP_ID=MMETSP1356-20130122/73245_1 /TAXON_ID=77927 ORGANISM="Hemiselmis virescens, Strain PCC157" /NCGR_SAMPLE_ID=MMETSP1356 /ASSEMBLY_ACC=CAM_ASM_000847 /LENGTH=77 /DNA_ID=CAMNT_0014371427 /DNA_START=156 /DNA_END=385 /DNA_ORIENTATION=+
MSLLRFAALTCSRSCSTRIFALSSLSLPRTLCIFNWYISASTPVKTILDDVSGLELAIPGLPPSSPVPVVAAVPGRL